MAKVLALIIIILSFNCLVYGQKPAFCDIVKENLLIVRTTFSEQSFTRRELVLNAANFLTKLTGIESTAGGSYIGRDTPNKMDLKNWITWLKANYKFNYWSIDDFKYVNLDRGSFR